MLKANEFIWVKTKGKKQKSPELYEEHANKLVIRNEYKFTYVGFDIDNPSEYIGSRSYIIFNCTEHGDFNIRCDKLEQNKIGCVDCYKNTYTEIGIKKIIDDIIKERNLKYKFVSTNGEWNGQNTKLILDCEIHGSWETTCINNFVHKNHGCPSCANNNPYTIENIKERVCKIIDNHNMKYKFIGINGMLNGKDTKINLECEIHGIWVENTINNLNHGHGCNKCNPGGYNKNIRGYFYIQKLKNDSDSMLKFGITNKIPELRKKQQERNSNYEHVIIFSKLYEDGTTPIIIESEIKNAIKCNITTKEHLPDGFTETTKVENLNKIYEIIEKYKE